ncbi:hypothetical protein ASG88_02825 [Nocardioides sp. Soil777]|uniref:CotH kinase family protein n=1 Tax=Nocardioides sp. Soil777 TaxID=1736409 RepID=UPI000714882A|nr:CotH kinase family protein [Nocardioides sp. Soil777]KRF07758.1 hypothetical protein ASG88_02825 [Nocardioides sp. Soil777]
MSKALRTITGAGLACVLAVGLAPARARAGESAGAEGTWVPGVPAQLVVATDGGAPVLNRDDYVTGTLTLDGVTHPLEIKGRGNSTWNFPKKPYKVKLGEDAALVGTTPQEDWVLLANAADRSALRTHTAFAVADRTRLGWTPQSRFVELVLNGTSQGMYQLTEQVEVKPGRVDIADDAYLLEINERFVRDGDRGFRTVRRRTPIVFKDPDDPERGDVVRVRRHVQAFEKALYGKRFTDPERGYRPYVDLGSFIDWYLVEELFRNQDSNFFSSVYVSWTPGGKLEMGPVWDFDLSGGTAFRRAVPPRGWHTRTKKHWISRMLKDPDFATRVKSRWTTLRPRVERLVSQLPAAATPLRATAEADWAQWHAGTELVLGSKHAESFDGEVEFLRDWLTQRIAWMSQPEVGFVRAFSSVNERARVMRPRVRLLGEHAAPITVGYQVVGGTATAGVDYSLAPGSLVYEPGRTLQSLPITLIDDREREDRETIKIRLTTSDDAIVGTPDVLTVKITANDGRR